MPRGRKVDVTSARHQKLIKKVMNSDKIMFALKTGVERGTKTYTKPYDIAIAILTEVEAAGFHIIPKPTRKVK